MCLHSRLGDLHPTAMFHLLRFRVGTRAHTAEGEVRDNMEDTVGQNRKSWESKESKEKGYIKGQGVGTFCFYLRICTVVKVKDRG